MGRIAEAPEPDACNRRCTREQREPHETRQRGTRADERRSSGAQHYHRKALEGQGGARHNLECLMQSPTVTMWPWTRWEPGLGFA